MDDYNSPQSQQFAGDCLQIMVIGFITLVALVVMGLTILPDEFYRALFGRLGGQ